MCYGDLFTPADTCDGAGFCIGGGSQTRSCAPYLCGAGACTTSCASDADCASGAHCDDGLCFPDADLGQPCDEDSDCQSGICAEGVCCNQRCAGLCETCVGTNPGVCSPVVCDDGLSCTSGACDEATGACTHILNPGTCLIAGQCYPAGTVNPGNVCQVCNPASDPHAWSAVVCAEDALPCSTAACHPATGCRQTLDPGTCLIGGKCYDDGDTNPDNACEVCDPSNSMTGWTAVVCAEDALPCTTATCDPGTGCRQTLLPGFCLIAGSCYDDGDASPTNACQVCDPAADLDDWTEVVCADDALSCTTATCDPATGCGQTINPGTCLIDGVCYAIGTVNPENACQVCDPTSDPDDWSARVCDDGLSCTADSCDPASGCGQTINPGSCLIAGVCYASGTVNPENACQVCDAEVNATGWSAVVCPPDVLVCTSASCDPETGCGQTILPNFCQIGAFCHPRDTVNAVDRCLICDPARDQRGWSARICDDDLPCTTATCDTESGCAQLLHPGSCLIGGVCYDDGDPNPANACQVCDVDAAVGAWTNVVCPEPANGTATCTAGTCGFTCDAGYTPCGAICLSTSSPCPCGYESLNGGCFQIAPYLDRSLCSNATCGGVYGGINGSDNYLCVAYEGTDCEVTSDCPTGAACWARRHCLAAC